MGFTPVEVMASNGYPVHNLTTGLNYTSIQEAINAPETVTGHTIFVDAGTYYESVVVNKTVSLIGEDNDTTIVDGNGASQVLQIETDGVSVSGFTVMNSQGLIGGGLFISGSNVQISDIISRDNEDCGIHITPNVHDINIVDTILVNNSVDGLLLAKGVRNVNVYNTLFSNNSHGIYIENMVHNISISGNTIINNVDNGIVVVHYSNATIQGNFIKGNKGVGISLFNHSNPLIQGNIITSNEGIGIQCNFNCLPEIHWNEIYGNDGFGVQNDDPSVTVNATSNYWRNGPSTSSYVLNDPWLTEPILHAEITSPLLNEIVSATVTVSTEIHARNGDQKVEFYIEDQLEYTDDDMPYEWNWNTSQYSETDHRITAKAYDMFGLNVSTSTVVFVDNSPPTVFFEEPEPENRYSGTLIVSVNAVDNRELDKVYVSCDNSTWIVMSYDLSDLLWTYDLDTTTLSDGAHTLTALALDQVGHPASTSTTLFTDNKPPQLTIQSPQSGLTVALTLSVTVQASDVSGISKIEYYLQDTLVHMITDTPYQWSWDTTQYPNGEYTILVKAYDTAGKMETSETTVTVENVALPWWQTQSWIIIEVLIALGGLTIGIIGLARRSRGRSENF
jgi:parallel beta-helix repeat protein